MEGLQGNVKYVITYALYLAHYMNDDAKKCRYLSDTNNFKFSRNSFKLLPMKHCKKTALLWIHL